MSWYPCRCTIDPPPCTNCTADLDTVAVEISGFVSDDCICTVLDSTYILSRTGSNACRWCRTSYGSSCPSSPYGIWMTMCLEARPLTPSVNKGWVLTISTGRGTYSDGLATGYSTATYRWSSGSSADFDCTATQSLSLLSYVPDPDPSINPCDMSSLTVTVNP